MVIKPAEREDRVTPTANRRSLSLKQLLLFLIVSILVHGLGLLLFALYQRSPITEEEVESKPIEFVVVPEESEVEPPETEKRATENSVAEPDTEPEETTQSDTAPIPVPAPEPEPAPAPAPEPAPAPPPAPAPVPKSATSEPAPEPEPEPAPAPAPEPEPEPEPEKPPVNDPPPVLSDPDPAATPVPEPTPEPSSDSVATNIPPQAITEPEPLQTAPGNSSEGSASDLLGGSYERTLANGGGDAFFSPEALEYQSVLNPAQLDALKDIDLGPYFDEVKRRVKSNWNPSYRAEEYTTFLTFDIQKNGQITGLRVTQSSGSEQVDRESLNAVQNSAPFAPLPPDFPLESLGVRFSFNIYIY